MTLSERLANEEERNHFGSLLESTCAAKEMGALVFEDHDAKRLLLLNRVQSGDRSNWTLLGNLT